MRESFKQVERSLDKLGMTQKMNILIPDSWLREYLETDATPEQIKDCLSLCGPSVERINKEGSDYIYEIEITSNRVDMVSVYGIAREAAAILPRFGIKAKLKQLAIKTPRTVAQRDSSEVEEADKLPMEVSDPGKICNRIMGIVLEVDPMKESPVYVKERLEKSGVRSLNNLVDITNYVMLEVGHPCHVFDYDKIKTHKFLIRFAKKNEPIITLDEKKYLLNNEDVIIDDGTGRVIDLPGIMGTENSVVNKSTRRIFFFIESNNPLFIRKTSMRYGIRTMAAAINEKHPDPELVKTAMLRGIELYEKIAGGKVAGDIIDIYPNKPKPIAITTTIQFINERLGIELKKEEIIKILESLSFSVIPSERSESRNLSTGLSTYSVNSHSREIPRQARDDALIIIPPTFRQFDVTIPEDIVEEVARIYGYHNLPSRLMTGEIPITDKPKDFEFEEEIKHTLKYWGYTEVYNYSFISGGLIKKTGLKTADHLKVANPLTEEIEYMRISLIPSMLETIVKNQPYKENLQLFELAKVYIPHKAIKTPVEELPKEVSILTITNQKSFYELKGIVEALTRELGIQNVILSPDVIGAKNPQHVTENDGDPSSANWRTQDDALRHFWHPQQIISLNKNGENLGYLGKIHPYLSNSFQIKNDLYIGVLNIELLAKTANPSKKYTPIPQYPPVLEDLTFILPQKSQVGFIIDEIYKTSPLIKTVQILDSFKNNITFRITYQSETKNLSGEDVKKIRQEILQKLENKFKIKLKQ